MNRKRGIDWSLEGNSDEEISQFNFLLSRKGKPWQNVVAVCCLALAVASVMLVLMNSLFGGMESWIRRSVFLVGGCIYVFILYPLGRKHWSSPLNAYSIIDLVFIIGLVLSEIYVIVNFESIASPYVRNDPLFTIVGSFLIVAVLEATRRCLSLVVVIVPLVFIVHALYADYFPGILKAPGVEWAQLVDITVNIDTLFGIAMEVMVGILGLFMLFGALLMETRVAAFFISLANSISGHRVGGPAKVAVVASGFLATISGSAVGNVATTGVITIPLMKKVGYSPETAGGIEACASNGGHITPPVMGLVAFLIAGTIGMRYGELALRATIPALLYFYAVYLAVDLWAKKEKLPRIPRDDLPRSMEVMREGGVLLVPVVMIIVVLALDYSATMSALMGVLSAIVVSFLKKETRLNPTKIVAVFEQFMRATAPLIVACGMIGIILGALFTSGVGSSFASNVYQLAGGNVFMTLLAVAFASLVLGMGMPVIAVYIIIATLIVPALIRLGNVELLQAHLFVFYFAVASGVTPPVCIVAFAAASIARANPMKTGYQAFMIGFAKFLIPILFFYKAALLLYGSVTEILLATAFSTLAIFCSTTAIQRYMFRPNRWYESAALAGAVAFLIPDNLFYNLVGSAVAAIVMLFQYLPTRVSRIKHSTTP